MNVRTKLRGAFATYIALLAGLSVYHVRTNRRAVTTGRELADIAARLRTTSTTQLDRLNQVGNDAQKYAITRDTGYLVKLQQTMGDYDAELRHLSSLQLDPRERDRLTPLSGAWREAMTLASQLGTVPYNSVDAAVDSLHSALDRVHNRTQAVGAASQDVMTRELVDSENAARAAEQVTLVAAGAAVILSILLSALIARSILDPLGLLTEGTREVSAGRFNHRLTPSGNDELAQVAREFNAMTERLDELDRIKSEFVSKVSHDLKTPLSSMQETNAVLLDEVPGPLTPKQRQLLDINQDSAQRLSGMLGKLLDLSRLEAGLAGERRLTDVRALMRRSVERVAHSAVGDHVVFPVDESPSHLLVDADADALLQVFENLLENAIKFLPHDGKVHIHIADLTARGGVPPERWATLRRTDAIGAVLVSVADEGPGIPDHEKEKVFARFYQAEAGRAVRRRGVGLGLSISREIVTDHGGAIWVSDNEPRGSVFQVLLPAKAWGDVKGGMLFPTARLRQQGTRRMNQCTAAGLCAATVVIVACARPSRFERELAAQQWSDAALVFATDTALRHDEQALYRAGILFGTPGRPTYDAPKARELLSALITQFPGSDHRDDANARMLLLDEIVRLQRDSAHMQHDLEARVSTVTRESQVLRARADSSMVLNDSLRAVIARMDTERRERDAQLQALRRELQRLKEIDLKPRPPAKP